MVIKKFLIWICLNFIIFDSFALDLAVILDSNLLGEHAEGISYNVWIDGSAPGARKRLECTDSFWTTIDFRNFRGDYTKIKENQKSRERGNNSYYLLYFDIPQKVEYLFTWYKIQLLVLEISISSLGSGHSFYLNLRRDEIKDSKKRIKVFCDLYKDESGGYSVLFDTISENIKKNINFQNNNGSVSSSLTFTK